eukprot:GHUV01004916.1.p1 GENE.GHUV01004916.1~~GHUV01004916.1.p1  ORF type:complete len:449 (+),score=138.08 GHUV01004916.1:667-2013(+)
MAVSRISSSSDDYESLHEVTHRPVKAGFRKKTWLIRGIGLSVLLGLFLATSLTIGRKDNLHKILLWLSEHRAGGFVIFALLYIWFTVLFLPPALLAACAGAIYGFLVAIPLVWFCAVLGETVSFLLGRFLLKKWVAELTADWPMWTALNAALKEDGWKLVALLRVSPVVPFSLLNYALGSSSLPFSHYFWPSVCGIVPGLVIYVWLGSLASDVTSAISQGGTAAAPPAAKIVIIVLCAVSALVVVVASAVYTKRAIDRRLAHVHVHEEVRVEEQHFLLGGVQDTAQRGVMVSVETPVVVADGSGTSREAEFGPGPGSGIGASLKGWVSTLGLRGWSWQRTNPAAGSNRSSSDGCRYSNVEDGEDQALVSGGNAAVVPGGNAAGQQPALNGVASAGTDRQGTPTAGAAAQRSSSGGVSGVVRGIAPHGSDHRGSRQHRKASKSDLEHQQ